MAKLDLVAAVRVGLRTANLHEKPLEDHLRDRFGAYAPDVWIESSGSVTLPWFDGGLADVQKTGLNVQIRTLNCSATETVTVHRLIQLLRRRRMTPERRGEIRRQVLSVLASLAPSDIEADDPRHASVFAELDKHLLVSGAVRSDDPEVRRWVANHLGL